MNESHKTLVRVQHLVGQTLATYAINGQRLAHMTTPPEPDALLGCAEELERLRTLCREGTR